MDTKNLGTLGTTSAIGLGLMAMSDAYGPSDRAESVATIHAALDAGIIMLDTGDFYGMGHNELLLGEALRGRNRNGVQISVKFGGQRDPHGAFLGFDGRPAAVKTSLAYSLQRLGADHIDVYRPARLDSAVPIEDTVGAIADMIQAGFVRHLGLSEVGADTIRRRTPCTRSATCRSSTHSFPGASRARSWTPAANSASGSPRTVCCPAV